MQKNAYAYLRRSRFELFVEVRNSKAFKHLVQGFVKACVVPKS